MEMYRKALQLAGEGRRFALGVVVDAQGSTPQKVGCKAIVDEMGATVGTLGGGRVEAQAFERMREALDLGQAAVSEHRLFDPYSRSAGPICGGVMRILANPHMDQNLQIYRAALEALARGEQGVIATVVDNGDPDAIGSATWVAEPDIDASVGLCSADELRGALAGEGGRCVPGVDGASIYVEPVISPPRLLIVGGGHVGQAVAVPACFLGFDTSVLDDRPEYTRAELFPPEATVICGDIPTEVERFPKGDRAYIVLVSKGHRPDAEALEVCIDSDVAYLGMMGSERKIRFIRKHFIESGLATKEAFDRVVAPIGVEIGAVTVQEIGVSICAQLVAARRLKSASRPPVHATSPK